MFSSLTAGALAQDNWLELKGSHFIVYYGRGLKDFAIAVLRKAEKDYRSLADYLGYARYSRFWTWDNRVKIYIYPDRKTYLQLTGEPAWSAGVASYDRKEIVSFAWSDNFLEFLLPHEITHLMFRDFVGFKGEVPLWLDEGVAQWAEVARRKQIKSQMWQLARQPALLPLKDMMGLDVAGIRGSEMVTIRSLGPEGVVRTGYIRGQDLVGLYYLQAASLVGFLIEKYGADNFTVFCRELRDGKTLEDALRATYPRKLENLSDLEREWLEYIKTW